MTNVTWNVCSLQVVKSVTLIAYSLHLGTNTTLNARSLRVVKKITPTACSLHLVTDITLTLGGHCYGVCLYAALDGQYHAAACYPAIDA